MRPENSFHRTSADDYLISRFSQSSNRRSRTPTPSTTSSRISSRRSTTPPPLMDVLGGGFSRSHRINGVGRATPTTPRTPTSPTIFSQSSARTKPQPIEKKLECTLEELCYGCIKQVNITRDAFNNAGFLVKEEETLKIKIKPGWKKGTKVTFVGKGDERPGTFPADIIFLIDEKEHPLFIRAGDDLELGIEVPLVSALAGCTITVPLLGGENVTLSFDQIIYPGFEKVIPGQGMPTKKDLSKRGDLLLKFLVEFPSELSDEQRSQILAILDDSSSSC